jgi:hypothetical protein
MMMKRQGLQVSRGLMVFWADIDADYLPRFQEWHNTEHIPERISIPGFNVGRRYRGAEILDVLRDGYRLGIRLRPLYRAPE